jgi:hypothetical protein
MALKVFLSYAREDREVVEAFYERLTAEKFEPWIDVRKILPGQNWEMEIDRALREANVVIAWLSNSSVSKRGFVQREANFAIDNLRYKLPTDIYFVPVLLEPCEVPTHLAVRQYIDINTPNAWEQLLASLTLAASQQSIALEDGVSFGPYSVVTKTLSEEWDGHPGHTITIEYPHFTSDAQLASADELSTFFEGRARALVIENRSDLDSQDPELFPRAGEFGSTNGYWENFQLSYSNENIVSVVVGVSTYGAGAAHPNYGFAAFNFTTNNGLRLFTLDQLFEDPYAAEQQLSLLCIQSISREYWRRIGEAPNEADSQWIADGCKPNEENFSSFSVSADGLIFHFAPYQVAAYAFGTWDVEISFYDLLPLLKQDGLYRAIGPRGGA